MGYESWMSTLPEFKQPRDPVGLWPWLIVFASLLVVVLLTKHEELKLRAAITAVEGDVFAIEHRLEQPPLVAAFINRRLDHLEKCVLRPRFTKHAAGCPQCRGDVANAEEGGPSPLCERGFAILKEDVAAWNEEPQ